MGKEDALSHGCQKTKLDFRIYYRGKPPFALSKRQVNWARAIEPLMAPLSTILGQEGK